jgi:hypothetical protein
MKKRKIARYIIAVFAVALIQATTWICLENVDRHIAFPIIGIVGWFMCVFWIKFYDSAI